MGGPPGAPSPAGRRTTTLVGPRPAPHGAAVEQRRADDRLLPGLLEFPLTDLFENRDYQGSTHFFFDIGEGNLLAFFDFPGLHLGDYAEVLGGLHHVAISVLPERWEHLAAKLEEAGVPTHRMSGSSIYFTGPDGERLELIKDPLGEMYGGAVR